MKPPSGPKKQTQFKPNLVRRRRIPKGQNRLPKNLTTPSKTKGPGKKWILFEQSYILAVNLLRNRTF